MPRQGRIDFSGAIHHVIIRGINRAKIFRDDCDRTEFIRRLERGLNKTGLTCYAWALIPNHAHILLRTGANPLTRLMSSLLTGYAYYFNHRYRRVGYLFQNRYKSILCEEEPYLLQLVRYIHLNPLRANLVPSIQELNMYPWSGHSILIGNQDVSWQDVSTILSRFGKTVLKARRNYLEFVKKGIPEGKRDDLTGGGLLRSAGGWRGIRELRKAGERWRGDERILGDSDFVLRALKITDEKLTGREHIDIEWWTLERLLRYVGELTGTESEHIAQKRRDYPTSRARALFVYWAKNDLGYTLTELAVYLKMSKQAVSQAVCRGRKIAGKKELLFPRIKKLIGICT